MRWSGSNEYPGKQYPARGRGVAAACRPFKPVGGGSNPSGPMAPSSTGELSPYKRATRGSTPPAPTNGRSDDTRPVVQRENTRLITGRRGFEPLRSHRDAGTGRLAYVWGGQTARAT